MTLKKPTNLISFKVSDEVLDQLERIQNEGESLSLAAKRLLEEAVGQAKPSSVDANSYLAPDRINPE